MDLVAFTLEGYGVELIAESEQPGDAGTTDDVPVLLRAMEGESARLVVRLPFQHLAERAIYEGLAPVPDPLDPSAKAIPDKSQPDGENARPVPPIAALPAKASRLVFELPQGDAIPFTIEGILTALGRLPMVVHPLARPRAVQIAAQIPSGETALHLADGLVATIGEGGLVVRHPTGEVSPPDPSTVAGLLALARDTHRLRVLLASNSGTAVSLGDQPTQHAAQPLRIGRSEYVIPGLTGPGGLVRPDTPIPQPAGPQLSRPPRLFETAIEAPFRLVISPSHMGGWRHATKAVSAQETPHHVELWHSRLGVRVVEHGKASVDERDGWQRIVRAIWARDREALIGWETLAAAPHLDVPFRSSLDGADRHMLVRQSAETWTDKHDQPILPHPVRARSLWISSLGAWLDLHGRWWTKPYSVAGMASILAWDHIAPMGRDQYVRVEYPGYLYPFGHPATLVKLTERKMKDAHPSLAALYQRKFIVVGEPLRRYESKDFPFSAVTLEPVVTPTLSPDPGDVQDRYFVPRVGGREFPFVLHCVDQEERPVRLETPLMWVAESCDKYEEVATVYRGLSISTVPADGQRIAFARVARGGDTLLPTQRIHFDGTARSGTSDPRLGDARVTLPAIEQLSPIGEVTIKYAQVYLDHGFGGPQNEGEVWAALDGTAPTLSFGATEAAGSDRAGGFLQPDLPIRGLSRLQGAVGDVDSTAAGAFDPMAFLAGALPKLFGIVKLQDLLDAAGIDLSDAPSVVSEELNRIEAFISDLERAERTAQEAVDDAQRLVQRAQDKAQAVRDQAAAALHAAQDLAADVSSAVGQILGALHTLAGAGQEQIQTALAESLQSLGAAVDLMNQVAPQLPPLVRQKLRTLARVLGEVLSAADLIEDVYRFLNGLLATGATFTFRFEWSPRLQSWPSPASPFLGITDPILEVRPDSLVLSVDGRANSKGEVGVEVLAELRDFVLHLLPGAPLVRFAFDHLSFRAGSSGKPDVDVVLQDTEFVGALSFVETLKNLIPFDGFSDPPFLDVTPAGVTAGFTLDLPNVAIGVFNLSNMSLAADVRVPFLGKAVTVGFGFCSRERPFTLAVAMIGGGGWFLMRLSPDGLDELELGLEAGAVLAVDFGVASGSISAMLGIYMRLEGNAGSLTGYFRLRGEVDVLGLISASIELYLELHYEFDTGKMVGRAQLTIKVEIFFFSVSVTIEARRQFAGSSGDPSFADLMLEADGTSPAWSTYCLAFAGA